MKIIKSYKIALFGGSNSIIKNGFSKGLISLGNVTLFNYALGATTCIQNLYELVRDKNIENIKSADLIITESNINDIGQFSNQYEKIPLEVMFRNLELLYYKLHLLKKPIVNLILPYSPNSTYKIINNIHRYLSNKYFINVIDMQEYYKEHNLVTFGNLFDGGVHQLSTIMRELGKNIVINIAKFSKPKIIKQLDIDLRVCSCSEMIIPKRHFIEIKNSMYDEKVYKIRNQEKLYFPSYLHGYQLIGMHVWNNENKSVNFTQERLLISKALLINKEINILKEFNFSNQVLEIHHDFIINADSSISLYKNNCEHVLEKYTHAFSYDRKSKNIDYINLVGCLCLKAYNNIQIDLKFIDHEMIKIKNELCFNELIPSIVFYKEIIDEYCNKLNLIRTDTFQVKPIFMSAKMRIRNHLSYKLGQAMMVNSKSLLGYIRMPFVLSYIKDNHKQEQRKYQEKIKQNPSLKLPSLENYSDYKEALKEKECLTYKLGQALMQADKTWYKGGYIKLWFEIRKLQKEFKKIKLH